MILKIFSDGLNAILELLEKWLRNYSVPDIKTMEYLPLTPESIELLKEQIKPMEPTNAEKFTKICLNALDTDPSTPDGVKDEVGCADTISHLIKKLYPDFPILVSTKELDMKLYLDKRFERITTPQVGAIIISPRTNNVFGHVGAWITSERIASNNSKTGLFQGNYTWDSWVKEFKNRRGLRIYIYKLK